jgi:hypothetical protein
MMTGTVMNQNISTNTGLAKIMSHIKKPTYPFVDVDFGPSCVVIARIYTTIVAMM